jgi:hypothetical protein
MSNWIFLAIFAVGVMMAIWLNHKLIKRYDAIKPRAFWVKDYLVNADTGMRIAYVYESFPDNVCIKNGGLWRFSGGGIESYGGYVSRPYAMRAAESFFKVEIVSEPRGRNREVEDNE